MILVLSISKHHLMMILDLNPLIVVALWGYSHLQISPVRLSLQIGIQHSQKFSMSTITVHLQNILKILLAH